VRKEKRLGDSIGRTMRAFIWVVCPRIKYKLPAIELSVRPPNLNPGDLLGFRNMGAYTMPIASPFNGFDVPETRFFKAK